MKKTIGLILAIGSLMMVLVGCSSTCKYPGCSDKAEKDGYCLTHYWVHEGEKVANIFGKALK